MYRPCQQNDNSPGDFTVWQQHRHVLLEDTISVDPRIQILNSLSLHIKEDLAKKRLVILFGDFNEDVFSETLNNFFTKMGLQNALNMYIDQGLTARSYFRGKTIIDGIWCSPITLESIRSLGMAPFYFVTPSDHRGLFCDIDIHHLLDENTKLIPPAPYRRLISTSPKRVESYSTSVSQKWFLYNIPLKVEQLEDIFRREGVNEKTISLLNKIDDQITEILTTSEKNAAKLDGRTIINIQMRKEKQSDLKDIFGVPSGVSSCNKTSSTIIQK